MQLKHARIWVIAVAIAAGFVIGALWQAVMRPDEEDKLTDASVLAFCAQRDNSAMWDIEEIQRTPEFRHVERHFGRYLSEYGKDVLSETLAVMMWRAAFLFGSYEQIEEAFRACILRATSSHSGRYVVIAMDLSSWMADEYRLSLLMRTENESYVRAFLQLMADVGPREYVRDYVSLLAQLMDAAPHPNTRVAAAYCIARWEGESDLGDRAIGVLEKAASEGDSWAHDSLESLSVLGRHGWDAQGTRGLRLPKTPVPTKNPIRGAEGDSSGPAEVGETD